MRTLFLLVLFQISFFVAANAQTEEKGFVIILSTKNYDAAVKFARDAAKKLNYKFDLRGLQKHSENGLTISREACEEDGFEYPTYFIRGSYDDGKYVSVEHTSSYEGLTPGYYFVVAASGAKGSDTLKSGLKDAKVHFKDAYLRYAEIYMGCMH